MFGKPLDCWVSVHTSQVFSNLPFGRMPGLYIYIYGILGVHRWGPPRFPNVSLVTECVRIGSVESWTMKDIHPLLYKETAEDSIQTKKQPWGCVSGMTHTVASIEQFLDLPTQLEVTSSNYQFPVDPHVIHNLTPWTWIRIEKSYKSASDFGLEINVVSKHPSKQKLWRHISNMRGDARSMILRRPTLELSLM